MILCGAPFERDVARDLRKRRALKRRALARSRRTLRIAESQSGDRVACAPDTARRGTGCARRAPRVVCGIEPNPRYVLARAAKPLRARSLRVRTAEIETTKKNLAIERCVAARVGRVESTPVSAKGGV